MQTKITIGVKVGDIMTQNFISTKPTLPLLSGVKLMVKKKVGSLIIKENNKLRGILTEKDVMWALSKKKDLSNVTVGDICTRKITTIKPSADLLDAIRTMKNAKIRRLPVTVNKEVIGLLTIRDILRIAPELFEIARESDIIKHQQESEKRNDLQSIREGICPECGNYDLLYEEENTQMCESCKNT